MLEHLVRVDDVEGARLESQGVDVADLEAKVAATSLALCRRHQVRRNVDTHDRSARDAPLPDRR